MLFRGQRQVQMGWAAVVVDRVRVRGLVTAAAEL